MAQAGLNANTAPRCLGIDVAKASVVICDLASGRTVTAANAPQALKAALAPFAKHDLAVCETTGGHERAVLDAAFALGLAIHRADARKIAVIANAKIRDLEAPSALT